MNALTAPNTWPFYKRSWISLKRSFFTMPFYRYTLVAKPPQALTQRLSLYQEGDAERGAQILRNEFTLAGKSHYLPTPWFETDLTEMAESDLHSFSWLKDLVALGGSAARSKARDLIEEWIDLFPQWDVLIWKPDILAERLVQWLAFYPFFGESADLSFQQLFFKSVALQARHLKRAAGTCQDIRDEIRSLKGLIALSISFSSHKKYYGKTLQLFMDRVSAALDSDGAVLHRSPGVQLQVFEDLVTVRHMLQSLKRTVPDQMEELLHKMAAVLKFFRHADGGLALFNMSSEENPAAIDLALMAAKEKAKVPQQLLDTGFLRAIAGKTMLFMDVGQPSDTGNCAFAGTMSLELSHGKDRLFVNCGAYTGDQEAWLSAQRTTAAHTALSVDDTSSSLIESDGFIIRKPRSVRVIRQEHDGNILIEASHDGYEPQFRLAHTRRIFLGKTGDDIRGEDLLTGEEGRIYNIRFHLHPRVRASIAQDKKSVLLILPSGSGWRFKTNGANLTLEDSVYMGRKGHTNKTLQIVISGAISPKKATLIKWAVQKQNK